MRFYTRNGDAGKTRIIGGHVYEKNHIRVRTYGKIDSLNSLIGYTRSCMISKKLNDIKTELLDIQQKVFDCGNDLAQINNARPFKINDSDWKWLEKRIDNYTEKLPNIEKFIIPGGSKEAALVQMCRSYTREVETNIVELFQAGDSLSYNQDVIIFFNRLSDYFFVVARTINLSLEEDEVIYKKSEKVFR